MIASQKSKVDGSGIENHSCKEFFRLCRCQTAAERLGQECFKDQVEITRFDAGIGVFNVEGIAQYQSSYGIRQRICQDRTDRIVVKNMVDFHHTAQRQLRHLPTVDSIGIGNNCTEAKNRFHQGNQFLRTALQNNAFAPFRHSNGVFHFAALIGFAVSHRGEMKLPGLRCLRRREILPGRKKFHKMAVAGSSQYPETPEQIHFYAVPITERIMPPVIRGNAPLFTVSAFKEALCSSGPFIHGTASFKQNGLSPGFGKNQCGKQTAGSGGMDEKNSAEG